MAISNKVKYERYCNEVANMTNKYEHLNSTLPTTCYKLDKETGLWHGYLMSCDNEILQDFGYNKDFKELENQIKIIKGER